MKRITPFIAVLLVGCSSPKYTYYFDYYQSARSNSDTTATVLVRNPVLNIGRDELLADASTSRSLRDGLDIRTEGIAPRTKGKAVERATTSVRQNSTTVAAYESTLSAHDATIRERRKSERKEIVRAIKQFRKEMRAKSSVNSISPPYDQATQKLDNELIVAISFAAVGITLSILGGLGAGFWIAGVICLGVGIYFFIDWLQKR